MPPELPAFGLHPNAEIGYLTNATNSLFVTIMAIAVAVAATVAVAEARARPSADLTADCLDFEMITTNMLPLLPDPSMCTSCALCRVHAHERALH